MKKIIRILIVALALTLLLGSATAYATTTYRHGYFKYWLEDGGITICLYYGDEETVTVPNQIGGTPVSKIAAGAFTSCPSVKSVILPDTIMSVESGAFSGSIAVDYSKTIWSETLAPESGEDAPESEATPDPMEEAQALLDNEHENNAQTDKQNETQTQSEEITVIGPSGDDGSLIVEDVTDQIIVESLDMEKIEENREKMENSPTIVLPSPSPSPSETPEASAEPEATPEAEEPAAKSGSAIGWIIGAAVLVCGGGAAVVLLRKKGGKA